LQVRIHPADEATLGRFAAEFAEQRAELQHVTFVSDPSLAAGGCIVTVGAGEDALQVDAALETQLAQITSLLLGESDARPTSIEGQARG
jgi:flagellar biosynthesis/type III secretory pathway protein FliH